MNRVHAHLQEIDMIGKLADLKEQFERQSVLLHALIQLLKDRQMLTEHSLAAMIAQLDQAEDLSISSEHL